MMRNQRSYLSNPVPLLAASLMACLAAACARPVPPASEVEAVFVESLPADAGAAAWRSVPVYTAQLIPQDLVEPRLMQPSTPRLRVQAATDGRRVAFRLAWDDATADDVPGPARFPDACAVQLPRTTEADVPDPQMGQPGRPVEITYWRASWQASVDGRPDTIQAIYPGAVVDHYPFNAPPLEPGSAAQKEFAKRYAPADAAGNRREGPRDRPVEDLVAEGPGTLKPAAAPLSEGGGRRAAAGWEVMISRPLPEGLAAGGRSQIAFGVWDGGHGEVGSRKMRSGWVPLSIGGPEAAR